MRSIQEDNGSHFRLPECVREGVRGTDSIGEGRRDEVDDDDNCRAMGREETQWDGHLIPHKLPDSERGRRGVSGRPISEEGREGVEKDRK